MSTHPYRKGDTVAITLAGTIDSNGNLQIPGGYVVTNYIVDNAADHYLVERPKTWRDVPRGKMFKYQHTVPFMRVGEGAFTSGTERVITGTELDAWYGADSPVILLDTVAVGA